MCDVEADYKAFAFRVLMKEHDSLKADIRLLGRMGQNICPVCVHYNHGAGNPERCPNALKEECFEWRGVKHG